MSLNQHQREYIEYINKQARDALCWCGWYPANQCGAWCDKSGKGFTAADKDRDACVECGNAPWEPGLPVVHNIKCSQHTEQKT